MNFSAPFPSAIGLRVRWIECAAFFCLFCTIALAQTTPAGDYTSALPSVQRVESEMKGTDATDTAARQVAVFEYLQTYIQRIKEARDYRGSYSPGELKLRTDYAKAQYDLTQSFTKTHTAQEVSAFNHLEGQYSVNNALDWIKQMEGQQAADTYKGAEASLSQSYQRNQDRIQNDLKPQQQDGRSATGRYYFFAIVPDAGGSLVWDVAASLAAGDNQVAFSQANAEPVR